MKLCKLESLRCIIKILSTIKNINQVLLKYTLASIILKVHLIYPVTSREGFSLL